MGNELLNLDTIHLHVTKGVIEFNGYDDIKQGAEKLLEQVSNVEVNDENIQTSKKMIATINKRVRELEDRRISIKKEMLEPYNTFESQVKDIVSIVKQADNVVRSQVKEIEERDREAKRQELEGLFNKRIKQYDFDISVEFEQFMKPSMLNKSKSISSTESEMVHWLEGLYKDLEIIDTLPDSLDVKAEYIDCLDLTQAMSIVRKRKESIERLKQVEKKKPIKTKIFTFNVFDEKDMKLVEMFMQQNDIKFETIK